MYCQYRMASSLPSLIFVTGTDGAGKSFHAKWLVECLKKKGLKTELVWSRFNNFFSKPLLGLARVTGHNYYKTIDQVLFGFHNFEHLFGFRELFVAFQSVDVNVATFKNIKTAMRRSDVVVCERGPWDTLVDVVSDTGMDCVINNILGKLFTIQVRNNTRVLLIKRSKENILTSRPELLYDDKLERKIAIYDKLAKVYDWIVINNNGAPKEVRKQISDLLGCGLTLK